MSRTRVLLVTKGHPFAREPFFEVFDANPDIEWTHVEQPAARALFHPDRAEPFDVFVCYDMAGIRFTGGDPPIETETPPPSYCRDFADLLDAGKGFVFLHHAIAGWPAWPDYAEIVGGRFHYQPAELRGTTWPASGYRHDVTHRVEVVDPDHPITEGLGGGFEITDELYLAPVFEDSVEPLLRSTHRFVADGFYSADLAIRGTRNSNEGWTHPPGSDLVGWAKHAGRSPVAYLQFGDGPATYADPSYRRVLANAVAWAASPTAHEWASRRADPSVTDGRPGLTPPRPQPASTPTSPGPSSDRRSRSAGSG